MDIGVASEGGVKVGHRRSSASHKPPRKRAMDVMPDISGDCFYPFQSRLHSPLQLQTSERAIGFRGPVGAKEVAHSDSESSRHVRGEQETRRRGEELVLGGGEGGREKCVAGNALGGSVDASGTGLANSREGESECIYVTFASRSCLLVRPSVHLIRLQSRCKFSARRRFGSARWSR